MAWLPEERETILLFDYLDKEWKVYTNITKHWRKFKKNGFILEEEHIDPDTGHLIDAKFKCPEKLITFRNLAKMKSYKEEEDDNEDILSDEDE